MGQNFLGHQGQGLPVEIRIAGIAVVVVSVVGIAIFGLGVI
jgi:hypothetical protein